MFGLTLGRSKQQVRILYKSGQDHVMWVYSLSAQLSGGTITKIEYDCVSPNNVPIHIGVDSIEAVYQIKRLYSVWSVIKSMQPVSYFDHRTPERWL